MASYSLQMQKIGRSSNRSATAAAAYRASVLIEDLRTGEKHDYRRKSGVEHTEIFSPSTAPDWASDRATLWNAAEASEKRKNSVVAREFVLALPHELDADARRGLASEFAQSLVDRYGVAADLAIHAPGAEGDHRNHHAHVMITTRRMEAEGLTAKTRELDGAKTGPKELEALRASWAEMQNAALERAGQSERVDHRSLEAQRETAEQEAAAARSRGDAEQAAQAERTAEMLNRVPEPHLGPAVTAVERKAKREAREAGREYQPVTERGAELVERREERRLLASVRDRLDAARSAFTEARQSGASLASAAGQAIRAGGGGLARLRAMRAELDQKRAQEGWSGPQEPVEGAAPALRSSPEQSGLARLQAMREARDREKAQERQRAQEAADRQARARLEEMREALDKKKAQERGEAQQAEKAQAAKQKTPSAKIRRRKIDRDIDL